MSPSFSVLFFAIVASAIANSQDNTRKTPPETSSCGRFGKWSGCASKCPPKCSTRDIQSHIYCIDVCVEGCRCNPGYLIEDQSGLCVKPKKCKSSKAYKKLQKPDLKPACSGYCT
ncbi:zonadhesin-like [Belonocnema kinseyi]|uniref:zonadhesin-like n=1 Tax=Belonocnema kinseyi TaxID=2817044 RepID=UPI00143D209E|nr:zonadhesin-like [Belonocnema kinseyi]